MYLALTKVLKDKTIQVVQFQNKKFITNMLNCLFLKYKYYALQWGRRILEGGHVKDRV